MPKQDVHLTYLTRLTNDEANRENPLRDDPVSTRESEVAAWSFLVLPTNASAKLPTRSMTTVEGTLNGHAFQAALEPDGQRGHWFKVSRALRVAASAEVGDTSHDATGAS